MAMTSETRPRAAPARPWWSSSGAGAVGGRGVVGGVGVGALVVVVGRDAAVVGAPVVAGRVVGGVVTAEVGGATVCATPAGPASMVVLVVDSTTVVSGLPILLPSSSPAATAAVVDAGPGRPSTSTTPAVATPVATPGRLDSPPPNPLPPREPPGRPLSGGVAAEFAPSGSSMAGNGSEPAA